MADKGRKEPAYRRLTYKERHTIWVLRRLNKGPCEIAEVLGRGASTVSRELRAGQVEQIVNGEHVWVYDYDFAQRRAERAAAFHGPGLKIASDHATARELERLVRSGFSPYAALEVMRRAGTLGTSICVKTVYNYIHGHILAIDESDLVHGFRGSKKEKPAFDKRRPAAGPLPRVSIEDRPLSVLSRKEFGHWEADTVVGPQGGSGAVLLTMVERKTRWIVALRLPNRKQATVASGIDSLERRFGPELFNLVFKSVTLDNGIEWLDLAALKLSVFPQARGPDGGGRLERIYFAHPYCSSERGSNEVAHTFLRRKWPKGTDFEDVTDARLADYVLWVNKYPRAIHEGASAADLFSAEIEALKAS